MFLKYFCNKKKIFEKGWYNRIQKYCKLCQTLILLSPEGKLGKQEKWAWNSIKKK